MKKIIALLITQILLILTLPRLFNMTDFILRNPVILFIIVLGMFLLATILTELIFKLRKNNNKNALNLENITTDFENIYQDLYYNNMSSLESMRKKARWRIIIQYVAPLLTFILGFNNGNAFSVSLMLFIVLIFINSKYISKYKKSYKEEIISNFVKLINNKLEYKPYGGELFEIEGDYKKAEFDDKVFNRFFSDDYIEGLLDNEIFVKMSDLHIQHHVGSGKNSHTYEVFQGIFVKTECNKDIRTYIKISKNGLKIFGQDDRVEMDSQEFEKYFDIYSENKILTMQLLTSDIMATLVDFYNKYDIEYEIVIKNNRIYMRFFTGAMFEPKIFGNSMDKKLLFSYFCILKFIVDITKSVNKALQEVEI